MIQLFVSFAVLCSGSERRPRPKWIPGSSGTSGASWTTGATRVWNAWILRVKGQLWCAGFQRASRVARWERGTHKHYIHRHLRNTHRQGDDTHGHTHSYPTICTHTAWKTTAWKTKVKMTACLCALSCLKMPLLLWHVSNAQTFLAICGCLLDLKDISVYTVPP